MERQFNFEIENNKAVLHASGKINGVTSRNFEAEVNALFNSRLKFSEIVFDFKNVEYISSSGLRVILYARKKLSSILGKEEESNSNLVVEGAIPAVKEIFDVTGFDTIIEIK